MVKVLGIVAGSAAVIVIGGCSKSASNATSPPNSSNSNDKTAGASVRKSVKFAADPDASKIDLTPKLTTVEEISAQIPPKVISNRVAPFETTEWKVKATLESVVHEKDGDYYLVLRGDKGAKTVVEVPDPALCPGSRVLDQIKIARKELEDRYHPTETVKALHEQATVTGIGYLGWGTSKRKKGATGFAGARLMPGTGFEFGS